MNLQSVQDKHVTIIGSGFGGMGMAIQLLRHGHTNFEIIEKESELGGTWRDNSYPGCACDVPSHLYSFSFEGRPDWSKTFPARDEIFNYITELGVKYNLYDKTRFNTEIASATYNDQTGRWELETTKGDQIETDILVTALGQLNRPKIPDFNGKNRFQGPIFHSARWEHHHDFENKRIAVIGNGPSAAQFIPELAKVADRLTVFQRSACHIVPREDKEYSRVHKFLFKYVPGLRALYRRLVFWLLETNFLPFNELPKVPLFVKFLRLAGSIEDRIQEQFDTQVTKPELRKALKPDYPLGCKRVVISDEYYPALMRDNVVLETSGIREFVTDGINTNDGKHHKFDMVIYGTGFESTGFLAPMQITGRNGLDLNQYWREGAEAYLGITVPNFPNMFMLYGPNTNLGTNSIIFMMEVQIRYILGALSSLGRKKAQSMEIEQEKLEDFISYVSRRLKTSVWAQGCGSWYKLENGKITNNWPDFPHQYETYVGKFDDKCYRYTPATNRAQAAE